MARGSSGGSRAGNENAYAAVAGSVAGVLGDVIYNSIRLPGYNIQSQIQGLSLGDIAQFFGSFLITAYGFSKGHSRLAPFGFGALSSQVATKIILPSFNVPRYVIYDIDRQGRLVPTKQFPKLDFK